MKISQNFYQNVVKVTFHTVHMESLVLVRFELFQCYDYQYQKSEPQETVKMKVFLLLYS